MALQLYSRSTEVKLVETLNGLEDRKGWQAIHFHLDGLMEEYQSDYQIKIAVNLIHDLLKAHRGGIYLLNDRGIILLCCDVERTLINKLIFQLRYLYMDDPLAYTDEGSENPRFFTGYDLTRDFDKVLDFANRRMALTVRKQSPRAPKEEAIITPPSPGVVDLSASRLASLEQDLRRMDVTKAVRRQPVCAVLPGIGVRRVFDELYIHIAHLRQTMHSDIDFFSNRWLFKYLTQIMDQRVLKMVGAESGRFLEAPVSINLNAETLLSNAFSEFDAALPAAVKVSIVLEVPVVDAFADISGFIIARNEAQKLGYRICLDGLTTKSLPNIDRTRLGVDLLKVQWNADAEDDLQSHENQELAKAIEQCGNKRIILCRCDSKQAVDYGQALGISLFQGRYIDTLLNPESIIEN